jgi:hypothetical protein
MTTLVLLFFAAILGCLSVALFFMLRGGDGTATRSKKMATALGLRVGFSVLLFACILLAWKLGYIHPTGIQPGL